MANAAIAIPVTIITGINNNNNNNTLTGITYCKVRMLKSEPHTEQKGHIHQESGCFLSQEIVHH